MIVGVCDCRGHFHRADSLALQTPEEGPAWLHPGLSRFVPLGPFGAAHCVDERPGVMFLSAQVVPFGDCQFPTFSSEYHQFQWSFLGGFVRFEGIRLDLRLNQETSCFGRDSAWRIFWKVLLTQTP